jgi:hypothetical protein
LDFDFSRMGAVFEEINPTHNLVGHQKKKSYAAAA